MLPDYHIHTHLCQHAEGDPSLFRARAVELGLPEMCFTDHLPNPDGYDPANRMRLDQFAAYRSMISEVANTKQPVILFGVEADYYEGCERFNQDWLPQHEFDLVLGSVHYIDNWGFDNPDERHVWDSVDVTNTWRAYFKLVGKLADTRLPNRQSPDRQSPVNRLADVAAPNTTRQDAESTMSSANRLADVVAHLDLPKKFGHRPSDLDLKEMAQPALDRVAAAGMAIEINSSGLRRQVHEIYPSALLLSLARERDIPICFGSDAHRPEEVGWQFDASLALARSAGYTQAVHFRGRRMLPYSLPANLF